MRESAIVKKIIAGVKAFRPSCWVQKLADRHTRGLPDLLIIWAPGHVLFVEVKRPDGKLSKLQAVNATRVHRLGILWVSVTSLAEVTAIMEDIEQRGQHVGYPAANG